MSFPRATLSAASAWLEEIAADGIATPTDDEIMDRYRLTSVNAARTLLGTLADAGKITLKGAGPERQIMIGRPAPKPFVGERPTRVIVTPAAREANRDPRSNIEKMRAIGNSLASARSNLGAPAKPAAVVKSAPISDSVAPTAVAAAASRTPSQVSSKTPSEVAARAVPPIVETAAAKAAAAAGRKQISCFVPAAAHLELVRRAEGKPIGTYLREQVLAVLSGTASDSNMKPLVPARITAAAIRDDMPVAAFVAMLIARGFASYEADCARGMAA